ncbi:MAG: hypothetical protein H0U70_00940 [Tatlockia sp.]|nr:hypothetical protein [Tatlockia sp.]
MISKKNWSSEVQFGYISNIADAEGIQLNGQLSAACSLFGGFVYPCQRANVLRHKVPGFDVYASLTWGAFDILAEYIITTRSFAPLDMGTNSFVRH